MGIIGMSIRALRSAHTRLLDRLGNADISLRLNRSCMSAVRFSGPIFIPAHPDSSRAFILRPAITPNPVSSVSFAATSKRRGQLKLEIFTISHFFFTPQLFALEFLALQRTRLDQTRAQAASKHSTRDRSRLSPALDKPRRKK